MKVEDDDRALLESTYLHHSTIICHTNDDKRWTSAASCWCLIHMLHFMLYNCNARMDDAKNEQQQIIDDTT